MATKEKPYRIEEEEGSGYYNYESRFKTIFLDFWYEKSSESFNESFDTYDAVGNDMINSLESTNPVLFANIFIQTLKTRVKEIE